MTRIRFVSLLSAGLLLASTGSSIAQPTVIVVVGAEGEPEYGRQFHEWSRRWQSAATHGGAEFVAIGWQPAEAEPVDAASEAEGVAVQDKLALQQTLERMCSSQVDPGTDATGKNSHRTQGPLWIVLIGHGTFDGKTAKFNLQGPDVSADELAEWLQDVSRPVAIVNCSSSSGPFINGLSAENRVVLTATKSGHETNFARFGDFLSQAIGDPAADLDKDEQTSLLEAFLSATRRTNEFYKTEGRLATEHALLDDNSDRLGTSADWFRGVRASRRAMDGAPADGPRAHQFRLLVSAHDRELPPSTLARRDELELSIAGLRELKPTLEEADYYRRLEVLLVELAEICQ